MTNKRHLHLLFIINIFTVLIINSFAQSITWQRTYNYYPVDYDDMAYCVCQTTDGNIIVAGAAGYDKLWVIKVNPFGDTIWTRTPLSGCAYAVTASSDGGCVLTGEIESGTAFTVKLSSNGDLIWNKLYDSTYALLKSIKNTDDGGFIACGDRQFYNYGLIIKIDSDGNLQWKRYYYSLYDINLNSVVASPGNFYWVAGSDITVNVGYKTLLLKLNSSGEIVWENRYSVNSTGCVGKKIALNQNNIVLTGYTRDTSAPTQTALPFIIKLDTNGNVIFKKNYITLGEFYYTSSVTNNYYLFITNIVYGMNHITGKIYMTDTAGNIYKQKEINDTGRVQLHAVYNISNNDILLAGFYGFYGPTRDDYFVIRTDTLLNPPPIGINNYNNNLPGSFVLYQNYPNPFNPVTNIKFSIAKDGNASLKIYDILGNEVSSVLNGFIKAGIYNAEINASDWASGVYFYTLTAGNISITNKMVLIK